MMIKTIRHLFVLMIFLACSIISLAQSPVDEISGSIRHGNVPGISRYFENGVAITIAGSQSTYSHSQAEMVLKDFFSKNSPKSFEIEHSSGNNSSKYVIGTLATSNGSYRTYFTVKLKDNNYILQEIRFEK